VAEHGERGLSAPLADSGAELAWRWAARRVAAFGFTVWIALVGGAALAPTVATAHPLDPVLFELRERADGLIDVTWKASRAQVPGVELLPILPEECRRIGDVDVEDDDDASIARWTADCGGSLAGRTVGVSGLESTDALLRVQLASGATHRRVLGADRSTVTLDAEPSAADVLHDYARLGIEHIASGIDHLLFVFGLMLLVSGFGPLLATITAFTIGHSVTLAAAALEVVTVPQAPVEVVIAMTIYVLAIELARRPAEGARPSMLRRRPWPMAFAFGLLHGLGFAGALREAGLPAGDVPLALFSFNVGIEVGQVAFVLVVLAAEAVRQRVLAHPPSWLRLAPVYAMGTLSVYWLLDRALAL